MKPYQEFLKSKLKLALPVGIQVTPDQLPDVLFDFQKALVAWAIRQGRAALFADTGLGKTAMQCCWADQIQRANPGSKVLILAPLAVARQTVEEARKLLGLTITLIRDQAQATEPGIYIINYEMLSHIDPREYVAVCLDESSCLKAVPSKIRQALIEAFQFTPYRLACTATPAPNDLDELCNHAEFLGIMSRAEMHATYFVNAVEKLDIGNKEVRTGKQSWRLKGHANGTPERPGPFWQWLSSWAACVTKPSDLGFDDKGYELPGLLVLPHYLESGYVQTKTTVDKRKKLTITQEQMFAAPLAGVQERSKVRKDTLEDRVKATAELASFYADQEGDQVIIWTQLLDEDKALKGLLPGAVVVQGSDTPEQKADALTAFARGETKILITKTSIAGFGLNFQSCHRMIFCGINDSWESYYQAIRRCYRFGQQYPVQVDLVLADVQETIFDNLMRKEQEAKRLSQNLIRFVGNFEQAGIAPARKHDDYMVDDFVTDHARLMLGDCVERMGEIPTGSIHHAVYSPPFSALYTYSNSERDMGNTQTLLEFLLQFRYAARELKRVMMPGRVMCCHIQDMQATLVTHGRRECVDLSGHMIRIFQKAGFFYQGRFTIQKNPQTQASRNKVHELMFETMRKDRAKLRPTYADFVLIFKAPGDNPIPVQADGYDEEMWIRDAHPCWLDVRETKVLNTEVASENADERHMCSLQTDVIDRCIKLYTNPGETVFTPFAGVGSEVVRAIILKRRGLGIELKPSYYRTACKNIQDAELEAGQVSLIDLIEELDQDDGRGLGSLHDLVQAAKNGGIIHSVTKAS